MSREGMNYIKFKFCFYEFKMKNMSEKLRNHSGYMYLILSKKE